MYKKNNTLVDFLKMHRIIYIKESLKRILVTLIDLTFIFNLFYSELIFVNPESDFDSKSFFLLIFFKSNFVLPCRGSFESNMFGNKRFYMNSFNYTVWS